MSDPRSVGNVLGQDVTERIRRKWPPNPEQRLARLKAAFASGYLKIGRLYCASCARRIEREFEIMGEEYDSVWFAPVDVDVDWMRRHMMEHDIHLEADIQRLEIEARKHGIELKTITAWLLTNKQTAPKPR